MVVFAYAVSVLFFDVYDMAIDTIFLCFCEYGAAVFLSPSRNFGHLCPISHYLREFEFSVFLFLLELSHLR